MKKCRRLTLLIIGGPGFVSLGQAASIFSSSDLVLGGVRVGDNFEVGVAGFSPDTNNWPPAEPPADLINGLIGGPGEKYLNFAAIDTGIIITPASGLSIVTSMTLWVANDSPERDPASYQVFGTTSPISGPGPFPISDFTLISEGPLSLPEERNLVTDTAGFGEVVSIGDGNAYSSYMILFPTVWDEPFLANSMQLSEIEFDGIAGVPEPGSVSLLLFGLVAFANRRKR